MDQHLHRPPVFFRPPPCENFVGRMPWGSPAHPLMKKYRPPFLRPPFGTSPEGLRFLPSHMQAPPMFGPRGATVPPHLMPQNNQKGNFRMNSCHNRMDNEVSDKEFWCETCDRSFNSKEMLFKHNSEHQKCGIDGCSFTAHANVVTKHIEMQHKTGLYDKIRNINTPEDISNWLKERKKNYPTKENIEKQKEQRKECFDRGEKLGENKSRFNNRSNNGRNNKNSRFQDRRNKFRDNKRKGPYSVVDSPETQSSSGTHNKCPNNNGTPKGKRMLAQDKITPKKSLPIQEGLQSDQNQMYCNLKPFQGISELVRNDLINDNQVIPVADDLDIEDDEWQELETKKLNIEKKASVCNALSNLINAYDSSDDESENMTSNSLNLKHQSNIQIKNIESTTKTKIILENTKASSNILESKIIDNLNEVKSNSGDSALTNIEKTLDIVSDDSGPDEIKTVKNCDDSLLPIDSVSTNIPSTSNNKRIRKRKHSNANAETIEKKLNNGDGTKISQNIPPKVVQKPFFKKKIPKTLLEKLLENDIKRERNMILQCVNYVVKNNFFKQSLDK